MEVINVKKNNKNKQKVIGNNKNKRNLKYLGYIIIFLLFVLIIYSIINMFLNYSGIEEISQPTMLILFNSPKLISLYGNEYSIQFLAYSNYSSEATFSITKFPIFVNPTMIVEVPLNNFTDVNLNSSYADLRIMLKNIGSNGAEVELIPIQLSLMETPTAERISFINNTLNMAMRPSSGAGNSSSSRSTTSSNTPNSNTIPSNTIASNTPSSTPSGTQSPSSSTSTTEANTIALNKAKSILSTSAYYPIMLNYTILYADEVNCSASKYNSTYFNLYGVQATGSDSYANISSLVPYKLTLNITNSTPQLYTAIYKTYSKDPDTTGNAIIITMNLSTNSIVNTTLKGAYLDMNSISLETGYLKANRIGACGIFICSTSKQC
ncbi:MAG: hypothetical protein ACP5UN_00130 [Candidatus Micrarchaeia archaeon]